MVEKDKAEIINQVLKMEMPRLRDVGAPILLSDQNITAEWVSAPPEPTVTVLSIKEITKKAPPGEHVFYSYFSKFEVRGDCVAITLLRSGVTSEGEECDSCRGGEVYTFRKEAVIGKASFSSAGFHRIPMNGKQNHILPPEIEEYRDLHWRREETLRVETAHQAEAFIERVGFTACMTDSRQPGPSLYIAVCGRRDAVMPHNVQKDPESSATWLLKDEVVRRGRVYYGKLARGKTMFIAPRMIPHFNTIWGVPRREEKIRLSVEALAILKVLRKEWEMATSDLRGESGVKDRKAFTRAIDELQAAMIVVPSEVVYQPKFSYIWTLAEGRFPEHLARKIERRTALREIARCFLDCAGMTYPGELAKITGLSRPEAGVGNQALLKEKITISPSTGSYIKSALAQALES